MLSLFKFTDILTVGSGKSSFFMAEKLVFYEIFRNC